MSLGILSFASGLYSCGSGISDRHGTTGNEPFAVIGGSFTAYGGTPSSGVAVITQSGHLYSGFAPGTGFNGTVHVVSALNDGSIAAGGSFSTFDGASAANFKVITRTGRPHSTFSTQGFNGLVRAILPIAGEDILVGGAFTSHDAGNAMRLTRLNSAGILQTMSNAICSGEVRSIMVKPDDDAAFYVTGSFLNYDDDFGCGSMNLTNSLLRIDKSGTVIASFAVGGTGIDSAGMVLADAMDGTGFFAGGNFLNAGGSAAERMAFFTLNGAYSGGLPQVGVNGFDADVLTIARAADGGGGVFAGGAFSSSSALVNTNNIAKLDSAGTIDGVFASGIGTGFNGVVRAILPLQDDSGDILVAGAFTALDGVSSQFLVRLNSDGTIDSDFEHSLANGEVTSIALLDP